jgi:hypothetical protein
VLTLDGGGKNGEFSGSMVAYEINIKGGYDVRIDQGMADEETGATYSMGYWRELIGSGERESL